MNKLIEILRNFTIQEAEGHYYKYHRLYQQKGWRDLAVEELNKIEIHDTDSNVKDNMEIAARLWALAGAYWHQFQEHYGSKGKCRGPDLQRQAYDLLYEKLGISSYWTKEALKNLCRWDISSCERMKIVDRVLVFMEHQKGYNIENQHLTEAVIRSCIRNDEHGDNVKALEMLRIQSLPDTWQRTWTGRYKRLFYIHLGRQEWVDAENLATEFFRSTSGTYQEVRAYANLGEIQIRQGKLVDGEATLHQGVVVAERDRPDKYEDWLQRINRLSCHEQLMDLYMQQERWTRAEEVGLHIIKSRKTEISKEIGARGDATTRKAAQIIKMTYWRAINGYCVAEVCYLHELYDDGRKLAKVYMQLKNYNEAQGLLEELMDNKMHEENPILVASKELLMMVYFELGEWEKAGKMQEKVVEEMTGRFGYNSEELIPALEKLAHIYQKGNRLGKRHHIKLRLLRYR